MIADIIINTTAKRLQQTFSYIVPDGMAVRVGSRVRVPFGRRQEEGIVVAVSEREAREYAYELKPICAVLSSQAGFQEEMIETAALAINGTTKAVIGENEIDFKRPFRRVRMADAIKEYTGYDIEKMSEEELYEACVKMEIPVDKTMGKGKLIDEIFGEKCEGHYIQPTFIYDYPKEMSPLTKKHRENPELTERFELFVNGKEVANAYSELNDPIDQLERFQDQLKLQERGDDEAMYIDYDFVRALEYGMPPTSGMGIGIDRLCMFLTNSASIQDVLFFPQMKPEKKVTVDGDEKYEALGIPKEWIAVVKKAGYQTVEALKAVGNTNKLHQELCGINKKEKLGLSGLTPEEVKKWLA